MPFAGKHKLTPVQASVQALPTLHSTSDTATILNLWIYTKNISLLTIFIINLSVLESVAKVYAVGGTKRAYISHSKSISKNLVKMKLNGVKLLKVY